MNYGPEFETDFMVRTLRIVQNYAGEYDQTLQLNCLLGLLVIPKEKFILSVSTDDERDFLKWGLQPGSFNSFGKQRNEPGTGKPLPYAPNTIAGVVHSLRNAVGHFRVDPTHTSGVVTGFHFHDDNGFDAILTAEQLKTFAAKLASQILTDLRK